MSRSATWHQNFRWGFETAKNARADSPARTDSPPTRVGFSKSRTADAIPAPPPDVDSHATPAALQSYEVSGEPRRNSSQNLAGNGLRFSRGGS